MAAGGAPRVERQDNAHSALFWVTLLFCLGAGIALVPLWAPLVLAGWAAPIARPLFRAFAKRLHPRKAAAGFVTMLLVLAFFAPLTVAALSLTGGAVDLGHRLLESKSGIGALRSLAAGGHGAALDLRGLNARQLLELTRQHATTALSVARSVFGTGAMIAIELVVFVAAFYTFLLRGDELDEWLLAHSPLGRGQTQRLSSVFFEVGRGLLVGIGLTGLLQGAVATIGYVACGVPQAAVLGLLTVFASLIPSIGAALVWAPVTLGLLLTGRPGAALVMLLIGSAASVVDNLARPLLARYGKLHMNGLLLFVAMLGGAAFFGASGLLLGPLFVRLAVECLKMQRESYASRRFRAGSL
jgi:predicted PurR-regulated permease PerM